MLALRLVLDRRDGDAPRTLVFDEVDAGIGGAAATAVGRALADLARDAPGARRDAPRPGRRPGRRRRSLVDEARRRRARRRRPRRSSPATTASTRWPGCCRARRAARRPAATPWSCSGGDAVTVTVEDDRDDRWRRTRRRRCRRSPALVAGLAATSGCWPLGQDAEADGDRSEDQTERQQAGHAEQHRGDGVAVALEHPPPEPLARPAVPRTVPVSPPAVRYAEIPSLGRARSEVPQCRSTSS